MFNIFCTFSDTFCVIFTFVNIWYIGNWVTQFMDFVVLLPGQSRKYAYFDIFLESLYKMKYNLV